MTQRTEAEVVVSNPPDPLPPPPPPSLLSHPHQTHRNPPLLPENTVNHTPSLSSEYLPRMSVSLHPLSNVPSFSSSLSSVTNRHPKAPGEHAMSHRDHVTSHMSHMTLRRREAQCGVPAATPIVPCSLNVALDSDQVVRSKIRRQVVVANGNCSPPSGVKRLNQLPTTGSEPVLEASTSPPARNLRFRPYTLGKT